MWFNNAKRTIIQNCSCLHWSTSCITSKEEIGFSCSWITTITAVNSILRPISTKKCSDWFWRFLFCFLSIGWPNEFSPSWNSSITYKFHSNTNITCNKVLKIWEEFFSNVFSIKLACSFRWEFTHFQFLNCETIFLSCIDDFSNIGVWAWFYHSEGGLSFIRLSMICGNITVFTNFQNSTMNGHIGSNIKILKWNRWSFNSFQEYSVHLFIIHFNWVIKWIEEQSVKSNDIGLLIIPFNFKNISLFFNWLCNSHGHLLY